jgi:hypothetical protein
MVRYLNDNFRFGEIQVIGGKWNNRRITNIYEKIKTIHRLQIEIGEEEEEHRYKTITHLCNEGNSQLPCQITKGKLHV